MDSDTCLSSCGGGSSSVFVYSRPRFSYNGTSTGFFVPLGDGLVQTVETRASVIVPVACTINRWIHRATVNSKIAPDMVITLNINTVASALTMTIGAGLTGDFIGAGGDVSVAEDERISYAVSTTGAGTVDTESIALRMTT